MPTIQQITFDAGRSALAEQESLVGGILQRTGTLLAAHALVASFLGASTIRAQGLHGAAWFGLAALGFGLVAAAIVLAPWRLRFAIDAPVLYDLLYAQATTEQDGDELAWLVTAAFCYQDLRVENAATIARMSHLSAMVGVLMVVQTFAWLTALALH